MKDLKKIIISGAEVFPLVEGGKGINGTDGKSSGAWAKEGGVGTISLVSPTFVNENGEIIEEIFTEKQREKTTASKCTTRTPLSSTFDNRPVSCLVGLIPRNQELPLLVDELYEICNRTVGKFNLIVQHAGDVFDAVRFPLRFILKL